MATDTIKDLEEWKEWEDSVLMLEANRTKHKTTPIYAYPLLAVAVHPLFLALIPCWLPLFAPLSLSVPSCLTQVTGVRHW